MPKSGRDSWEEKFYAAGKILGSRFIRREGRPTDEAVLSGRIVDRTIRPLFPKGMKREVQVIISVISLEDYDADILAVNAASLALATSDIPFKGPVSSLYGSNAAAGVINVITKKAVPGCRLGASYGTYNTFRANAGAGAKIKNLSLSADGSYLTSDGYNSAPDDSRAVPDYTVNKYVREKSVSARASRCITPAHWKTAQNSTAPMTETNRFLSLLAQAR